MVYQNRLYELRNALRKSQEEMADILNISQSEYSRIEKGKRRLGQHEMPLKKYFIDNGIMTEDDNLVSSAIAQNEKPKETWVDKDLIKDLPVYGKPLINGGIEWTKEAVDMFLRSPLLKNNNDAYVTQVAGDDMKPRLLRGNKVMIDPTSAPIYESLVLVEFKNNKNVRYFREFVKSDSDYIHLKVYNPENIQQYKHSEIEVMHKVFSVRL